MKFPSGLLLIWLLFQAFPALADPCVTPTPMPLPDLWDALYLKVQGYQARMPEHTSGYGGIATLRYTDLNLTTLKRLHHTGDSTAWTGVYLASQVFRYQATQDPEALQDVKRITTTLHHHKAVTQTPGYVGRYIAEERWPWNTNCPKDVLGDYNCALAWYRRGTGPYAGTFWQTDTSRDMICGWLLGYWTAHHLFKQLPPSLQEGYRTLIEDDIRDFIDTLEQNGYVILDETGQPTPSGNIVTGFSRIAWAYIAADIIDEPAAWQRARIQWDLLNGLIRPDFEISVLFQYSGYYPFNLNHLLMYTIAEAMPPDLFSQVFDAYFATVRTFTENTWNAWFDSIYLYCLKHTDRWDQAEQDRVSAQIAEALQHFQDAPNRHIRVCPPPTEADPLSTFLHDNFPEDYSEVAATPYPIPCRSRQDFLWQRSPASFECSSDAPDQVEPGVDYLCAYWLARAQGFVGRSSIEPTPLPTDTPTSTPTPTATPTRTPRPTNTPSMTPTPVPQYPKVLLGGYWNSRLNRGEGTLSLSFLCDFPEGGEGTLELEGASLPITEDPGFFFATYLVPAGSSPGVFLLRAIAKDLGGKTSRPWPFLVVE